MKSPQIFSLIALVATAVGVLAVFMDPPTAAARHVVSADRLTRVDGLADESREVDLRLSISELRPSHRQRAAVVDGVDAGEGVDARQAGSPQAATLAELQEFREYVASTISEMRTQEAASQLRALEEQAARLDETMPTLEEWLALTPHQADKMRSVLLSRLDRETEYLRLWEQGADEEILSELKVSDREAHLEELAGFLTAAQLEAYLSRGTAGGR